MIKRTALVLTLALGLTGCQKHSEDTQVRIKHTPAMATVVQPARTPLLVINNCEDSPSTPCITWDERQWRLVTSYDPYTMRVLPTCKTRTQRSCVRDSAFGFVIAKIDGKIYRVN